MLDGGAAAARPGGRDAPATASSCADGGLDLALIGIGENGHLAFNDPHVADFDDPLAVKVVEIDDTSRRQQVRDGAFPAFDDVPRLAMTVTMSAILASRSVSVVVPGAAEGRAVAAARLTGPIEIACPASALRRHPDAVLFVDAGGASREFSVMTGTRGRRAAAATLAIDGGTPGPDASRSASGRCSDRRRRTLLLDALRSGVWGSIDGTLVKQFEGEFAALQDARHGVSTVNATMGLSVALKAVGDRPRRRGHRPARTRSSPPRAPP